MQHIYDKYYNHLIIFCNPLSQSLKYPVLYRHHVIFLTSTLVLSKGDEGQYNKAWFTCYIIRENKFKSPPYLIIKFLKIWLFLIFSANRKICLTLHFFVGFTFYIYSSSVYPYYILYIVVYGAIFLLQDINNSKDLSH